MVRVQINFKNIDDKVLYRKLEIVARKRNQSLSSLCVYIIRNSEPDVDSELNIICDKSDEQIRREIQRELSDKGITIKKKG